MIQLFIGLILPHLLGCAFTALVAPSKGFLTWVGYGGFLGWTISSLWIWALYQLSASTSPFVLASGLCAATVLIGAFAAARVKASARISGSKSTFTGGRKLDLEWHREKQGRQAALCIFVLSITTSFWLALNATNIPLFPWDGWGFWARQTKQWYFDDGIGFRLSDRYPPFFSLIQLWMCKFAGEYDDVTMNYPFLWVGFTFLIALFSQARHTGATLVSAGLGVLVLLVSPIFSVHLALPGYADLITCIAIGLAFPALVVAAKNLREGVPYWREDFILFLLCALSIGLYKRPGIFWTILFAPTALYALRNSFSRRNEKLAQLCLGTATVAGIVVFDKTVGYDLLRFSYEASSLNAHHFADLFFVSVPIIFLLFFGLNTLVKRGVIGRRSADLGTITLWSGVVLFLVLISIVLSENTLDFWFAVTGRALLHAVGPVAFGVSICLSALFLSDEMP
jgi:hypothetical protein